MTVYAPTWPDGKRRPRNIYAATEAECKEKLAKLIQQMNIEIVEAKRLVTKGKREEGITLAEKAKAGGE